MGKHVFGSIINVEMKEKDVLPPILASFQHGNLIPEEAPELSCTVSRNLRTGLREFAVETKHTNVIYRGSEESDNKLKNPIKTLIAIHNRRSNKVRLIEATSMLLSPVLKEKDKTRFKMPKSKLDISQLHKSFGSKIVRRRAELKERSAVDGDVLAKGIQEAVANIEIVNAPAPYEAMSLLCPPCNRTATDVASVYQLKDFITPEELKSMEDEALKVMENANNLSKQEYTLFFEENLPKILRKSGNQMERLEILLYIDCLLKFIRENYKPILLAKACPYSLLINKKISQEFTEASNFKARCRPLRMKKKIILHIIVLCFILFDFSFDLNTIINSSKESITMLKVMCKGLGATVSKDSTVVLKLPLIDIKSTDYNRKRGGK